MEMEKEMGFTRMAIGFFSLAFLLLAGTAWAYTINDNTLVGRGTTNGTETSFYWTDHVDNNPDSPSGNYNIFGINTVFTGGNMKISLYSNFDGSDTGGNVAITLADLALDLNLDGRYEYGVALTNRGIAAGKLYSDTTWNTSKYYLEGKTGSNYYYGEAWGDLKNGPNPIVHIGSGTALGDVSFQTPFQTDLDGYPSYLYDLTIPLALFGDNIKGQIGIFWAGSTCANDIIVGTAPVPIPASILLLSSGLLGMLAISKRRRSAA